MSRRSVVMWAVVAGLVLSAGAVQAVENFVPDGHLYAPGSGPLPHLNSPQDRVDGQADIYQSEIWRIEMQRKMIDTDIRRLINRDMSPGGVEGPIY